jgi:esterase
MSDDVRDFMLQHDLPQGFLAGHSMGGKTAMWTALKYPGLVERLVVIDIAPKAYPSLHDTILETLESLELREFSSRGKIDQTLAARISQQPVRQFLMKNLARDVNGSFRWKMNLPAISSQYADIMKGVEIDAVFLKPTLFVRSKKSSYIVDTDLAAISKFFPNSSVVDFDTGHWVHAEAPEQLTRTLKEFLLDA